MVSMDISFEKRNHLFRIILTVISILLLYFISIKPVRIKFNSEILYPKFSKIAENHNTKIIQSARRINILPKNSDLPRGFGIPFGGYFWLPLSLFFITSNKKGYKILISYHIFLAIIPPFLAWLFIKGKLWAGTLLEVNEMMFTLFFLLFLYVGIKDTLRFIR